MCRVVLFHWVLDFDFGLPGSLPTWMRNPEQTHSELTYSISISQSIVTLRFRPLTVIMQWVSMYWNTANVSLAPGDENYSSDYIIFRDKLPIVNLFPWFFITDFMHKKVICSLLERTYVTPVAKLLTWHVHNNGGRFALNPQDGYWLYCRITIKSPFISATTVSKQKHILGMKHTYLNWCTGPSVSQHRCFYEKTNTPGVILAQNKIKHFQKWVISITFQDHESIFMSSVSEGLQGLIGTSSNTTWYQLINEDKCWLLSHV